MSQTDPGSLAQANDKVRRAWAKRAGSYEKAMGFVERHLLGTSHRPWACSRARGETLEMAIGSGLNLPHYPADVRLTGVDLSPEMLDLARSRADELGLEVRLEQGDAHELRFDDGSFDTVVCTYALCGIPDPDRAVGEMKRVLRPGGRLVLVDHIRSSATPVLWGQKAIEFFTIRLEGEHMTRRPAEQVEAHGFEIVERARRGFGEMVERLVGVKNA